MRAELPACRPLALSNARYQSSVPTVQRGWFLASSSSSSHPLAAIKPSHPSSSPSPFLCQRTHHQYLSVAQHEERVTCRRGACRLRPSRHPQDEAAEGLTGAAAGKATPSSAPLSSSQARSLTFRFSSRRARPSRTTSSSSARSTWASALPPVPRSCSMTRRPRSRAVTRFPSPTS